MSSWHRLTIPWVVLACGAFVTGCVLNRSGTGPPEGSDAGSGIDAAHLDAGAGDAAMTGEDAGPDGALPGDDAAVDAALPGEDAAVDAGADAGLDAGFDAGFDGGFDAGFDGGFDGGFDAGFDGGFDAGFDAGSDAGFDAGPVSCDAMYGAAAGYIACASTPTECEFFTRLDRVRTCTSTCAALGGACLRRWRDRSGAGNECRHRDSSSRSCGTTGNSTDICVCTRP